MSRLHSNDLANSQINVPIVDSRYKHHLELNNFNNTHENITHPNDSLSKIAHNNIVTSPIDNLNKHISNLTTQMTSPNTTTNNTSDGGNYADWFQLPKMDNLVDAFSLGCSTAVIFGGLIPYIPQYLKIKHSMSSEGFSTYGKC